MVQMYMVDDDSAELSMYETKDIDWIGSPFSSLASDAIPSLSKLEDFTSYDIAGTYY
jgi:ABC-type oligopeptide transport system substrate-binding subunit